MAAQRQSTVGEGSATEVAQNCTAKQRGRACGVLPKACARGERRAESRANSLELVAGAMVEPGLSEAEPEQVFQFEREGYFVADRYNHTSEGPVFNMAIGLRDTWSATNG